MSARVWRQTGAFRDVSYASAPCHPLWGCLLESSQQHRAVCRSEPDLCRPSSRIAATCAAPLGCTCHCLVVRQPYLALDRRRDVSCQAEEKPGNGEQNLDVWGGLRNLAGLGPKPAEAGRSGSRSRSSPAKPKRVPYNPPGGQNREQPPPLLGLGSAAQDALDRALGEEDRGGEDAWSEWARPPPEGDWEESASARSGLYTERRRRAWESQRPGSTPRDSFLRPMVDLPGAKARLRLDSDKAAQELQEEFDDNRWESQEALRYAAFLFGVPLLVGFVVSRLLGEPFLEVVRSSNPTAFALSDAQKVEGAHEVHIHEMRLRMDAALGRAPPLTEREMQIELRKEAKHLEHDFRERNRQALVNVLSDGTSGTLLFAILARRSSGRANLFRTLSRFASGLSDTAKAFLIIAGTDILLGYHSEEGWTAALRMLSGHYGMEADVRSTSHLHNKLLAAESAFPELTDKLSIYVLTHFRDKLKQKKPNWGNDYSARLVAVQDKPIFIFVAIVPVVMDAIFKYWIFKGLNRQNPAAAATLRSMDRH